MIDAKIMKKFTSKYFLNIIDYAQYFHQVN